MLPLRVHIFKSFVIGRWHYQRRIKRWPCWQKSITVLCSFKKPTLGPASSFSLPADQDTAALNYSMPAARLPTLIIMD